MTVILVFAATVMSGEEYFGIVVQQCLKRQPLICFTRFSRRVRGVKSKSFCIKLRTSALAGHQNSSGDQMPHYHKDEENRVLDGSEGTLSVIRHVTFSMINLKRKVCSERNIILPPVSTGGKCRTNTT